jgi:hypothetical protein
LKEEDDDDDDPLIGHAVRIKVSANEDSFLNHILLRGENLSIRTDY